MASQDGSLLLKSVKADPRNKGKPLLKVTCNICSKVPSSYNKYESSDLGLNNLMYFYLEIYINIIQIFKI